MRFQRSGGLLKLIWILMFLTAETPQGRLKQAGMVSHSRPELCIIDSLPNYLEGTQVDRARGTPEMVSEDKRLDFHSAPVFSLAHVPGRFLRTAKQV